MYNQFIQDTTTSNRDGFGAFCAYKLNKSKLDVNLVSNFGVWFRDLILDSVCPVIGHVRLATHAVGKKTIDDSSSHPFETNKLVLAHNGVLEYKDLENEKKHKDITVDTQMFLAELDERYNGNNFVAALQETMELFYGTFAFLIYSKLEDRYFIVRGRTKQLNVCTVSYENRNHAMVAGIVVNTDALDLEKAIKKTKALAEMNLMVRNFEHGKTELLKSETIYELIANQSVLLELGTIKENDRPVKTFFSGTNTTTAITTVVKDNKFANKIVEFLRSSGLSISELDYLVYVAYESCFFEMTEEQFDELTSVYTKKIKPFQSKAKEEIWIQLVKIFQNSMDIYKLHPEIKFPHCLNSKDTLKKVLNKYTRG